MATANQGGGDDRDRAPCPAPRPRGRGQSSLFRIFLGAIVGTAVLALIVFRLEPTITGRPSPFAGILGVDVRNPHGIGLIVFHAFNGSIVFPLGFAFLAPRLPGPWVARGLIWGLIIWLSAEVVIMPMVGYGFFGRNAGVAGEAVSVLGSMLAYGVAQGTIAGLPGRTDE